jgi:hypothetical protein
MLFIESPDGGVCNQPPPGYAFHCSQSCDLWSQDCPRGQKCAPWANDGGNVWNATKCAPLDPSPRPLGDPCTVEGGATSGIDNCEVGGFCFAVDPITHMGTCIALCSGSESDPECPASTECMVANDGALPICLPPCDPLADVCVVDEACRPASYGANTFFCLPVGIVVGCHDLGGCGFDELCVPPDLHPDCGEDEGCCTTWCDLIDPVTADAQCDMQLPGSVCTPYLVDDAPVPGHETLGYCGTAG